MEQGALLTKRLILRPFTKADAPQIFRMSQESLLRRFLPDQVYASIEEAEEIALYLANKVRGRTLPYVLGMERADTRELIGHVGISRVIAGVEIGYAVAMAHQGNGFASEGIAAFSAWAMEAFSLVGLWGIVRADNLASRRVLEKAGYCRKWERQKEAFGQKHLCMGYFRGRGEKE